MWSSVIKLEIRMLPFLATGDREPSAILTLRLLAQGEYETNRW